ncbi:hypothetical protein P7K49_026861, partial [Saguinus oedipus]
MQTISLTGFNRRLSAAPSAPSPDAHAPHQPPAASPGRLHRPGIQRVRWTRALAPGRDAPDVPGPPSSPTPPSAQRAPSRRPRAPLRSPLQ